MSRLASLLLALALLAPLASAQTVRVTADVTANTTWTAGNTYLLDGLVFVASGARLTIEAGTVVKGVEASNITTGDGASALVVRRGAQLVADGTQDAPVIFTAEIDDVADPFDTLPTDRGLWGGVIVLGRAPTNANDGAGNRIDVQVEGIPAEEDALYGGSDPDDSSGSLTFVSIRHGGFSISGVEGDEINGLTLGAVGAGTTVEHVEVYANLDDCFEFFGGTVEAKYLAGAFCGDDTFDYDEGFSGKGQYWFSLQAADIAGRAGEHDGGNNSLGGEGSSPFSIPTISNVTYIGSGQSAAPTNDDGNSPAVFFRDNAGGRYYNSVWTDFPAQALRIEDLASGADSRERLDAGDLVVANSLFWAFGAYDGTLASLVQEGADRTPASAVVPALTAAGTVYTDPGLRGVGRAQGAAALDPRPGPGTAAAAGADFSAAPLADDFFDAVDYRGAFAPSGRGWLAGWTALDSDGFLNASFATATTAGPAGDRLALDAFPNPTRGDATVRFTLDRTQTVRITLVDALGRRVAVVADGTFAAGAAAVPVPTAGLAPGVYVLRLDAEAGAATRTVSVVR
ncbi:T9SS type A sorting domain-containing protein [Rubrivirga sp. IMCC45206]|uniref:T9SS type A sorting domain-containing protein n=1 Tax=Rubrivirga sp. IMCC45206 TaxID=3391614 RepID=UPI00398FC9D0